MIKKYLDKKSIERREEVKKLQKDLANLAKFGVTKNNNDVTINEIPLEFEKFQNTNDEWAKVAFPSSENITSCVYKFTKFGDFPKHKHSYDELIIVLDGSIKIQLYDNNNTLLLDKIIIKNESFYIKPNVWHYIKSLSKKVKIICNWGTDYEGWKASFKNN